MTPPEVTVADITGLRVDAIVNAANRALAGGGESLEACRPLALAGCDRSSLALAAAHVVDSIGFPAISTGADRSALAAAYALAAACAVAAASVTEVLATRAYAGRVVLCLLDDRAAAAMRSALA